MATSKVTLSDSELFEKLQAKGLDVGPITDATRAVYVKKYQSLCSQPSTSSSSRSTSDDAVATSSSLPTVSPMEQSTADLQQTVKPTSSSQSLQAYETPLAILPPTIPYTPLIEDVVMELAVSFDEPNHPSCDTAFLFPQGEVVFASRSILATQCSKMIPILYNNGAPYTIKVMTLSGQLYEMMVRGEELIRDLKEKIGLLHDIAPVEQRLVFMEQELDDTKTISSYEIFCGATVHLVLVAGARNTATVRYSCPKMSPTLSISHFNTGLSLEQLSYFPQPAVLPQHVTLPAHLTHVVHVHDNVYTGFKLFLQYLYSRDLQVDENASPEWSSFLLCYVLGELFQLPNLVQASLLLIGTCLDEKLAHAILEFSRSIQSPSLEHKCLDYIQTKHPVSST